MPYSQSNWIAIRDNMTLKLHTRSIVFIIICFAGLLGIGFFGILPNNHSVKQLNQEIEALNEKIARQKVLTPIFKKLITQLQAKDENRLPMPEKVKISQAGVDEISKLLKGLADENQLKLEGIASDVDVFSDEASDIKIDLNLSGDFFSFRQMLLDLEALPYLENIEEFSVSTSRNTKLFSLKLVVAQQ